MNHQPFNLRLLPLTGEGFFRLDRDCMDVLIEVNKADARISDQWMLNLSMVEGDEYLIDNNYERFRFNFQAVIGVGLGFKPVADIYNGVGDSSVCLV